MKRKLAVLTAAIIGLSTTAFTTVLPQEFNAFTEIDASALTIIAEIKELSLEKDTIEIGETTHLNAKFDSGITDNAECGSSNSSVVKVVSGSVKDGWEIEGIGEGTAKILVHNGIYEKSVEITVTSTQSTEEPIPVPTEELVYAEPGCYMKIVSQPDKTVYWVGDKLELTGLKIDVMYAPGGAIPVSQVNNAWRTVIDAENPLENENFIVDTSEFDSSKAGEYNIKVSLTDDAMSYKWWYCKSIDIPVTVVENDTIKGDVNADGAFTVADVVMLQKWLLGVPDVTLTNWKAADLCEDGELNVFDLCMMKRNLLNNNNDSCIEPENYVTVGNSFEIIYNNSKMYSGPGEEYPITAIIPKNETLIEKGYNSDSNDWVFTQYKGQYGWIKTEDVRFNYPAPEKPVIYLYPEEETDVHVELELKNAALSTTYPKYNGGWDVTAMPDGTLINKADGTKHSYLFWDACNDSTRYDFSKGFCVAGEDTEAFLKEKLTYMGLNEQEMNEFIVYWLPLMEHNAYNLISFQTDAYTDNAKLNITPNPDSLLRIFMTYIPLDVAVEIAPQQLETFERKGFTVVEWGGTKIG